MFTGLRSLRSRINLLILLALLPAVALTVYVNLEQRGMFVSEVKHDLREALHEVVLGERHQAITTLQILVALNFNPHLDNPEPDGCSAMLQRLLPAFPQYGNFVVYNADGTLYGSAAPLDDPGQGVSRASIELAARTRQFTMAGYRINPRTERFSVWYGYPLKDANSQVGKVIFAELKLDWLHELVVLDRLKDDLVLSLLDNNGTVVAGYPTPKPDFDETFFREKITRLSQPRDLGMEEALAGDGTRKLHAFMPLEGAPPRGYVVAEVPLETIYSSADENLQRNLLILGSVTMAALMIAGLFGQTLIVRKMNRLLAAARQLSGGDYKVRSGMAGEKCEFGQLGQAFDEMALAIDRREHARNISEEALKKSEADFKNLVENSLSGIGIVQDNRVIFLNPEHERLSGLPFRQSRPLDFDLIHPEDAGKIRRAIDDLNAGRTQTTELTFRFYRLPGNAAIEAERLQWVHCRARRILYQDKPSILINMMDITQLKELEQRVHMQDKMTSLGRVTAGILHELRNPASALDIHLINLERLYSKAPQPASEILQKAAENLVHLKSISRRIDAIIKKVTDFSKPGAHEFVPADINGCIRAAVKYCNASLRKSGTDLSLSLAEKLPDCPAAPFAVEQVLVNLIENAIGFMQDSDRPRQLEIASHSENGFVVARVGDAGPGVPLPLREKIFDPFFSTRNTNMGIGLSICQRIVLDHGGSLKVGPSRLGGAEFIIKIPVNKASEA
jgi:PAS domain S-box-containing protein